MADLETTADVDAFLGAADKAAMRAAMDLAGAALLAVGTTAGTVAAGDHNHTGVYEAANANIQSHISNTSNPHSVTKAQVGLTNVTDHAQTQAAVVPNTAPAAGQMLVGNAGGTAYAPVSASGDATLASTGAITIVNDAVTNAKAANMAASTIKARKTASTGDPEDCTLSEVLDLVGSAAQGDILYRGASSWTRLGAGTSGQFLKTLGAGANPTWDTPSGGGGGAFVQRKYAQDGTYRATTVAIPGDNTIPQNTEGVEHTQLAVTITPTSATNILCIEATLAITGNGASYATFAIFQDSTADALSARSNTISTVNYPDTISWKHYMVAGTTSATTFKLRFGPLATSYSVGINGGSIASSLYNGTLLSNLSVTELTP